VVLPDWLLGIGLESRLRRSRSDIERTGVTRCPAGVAEMLCERSNDKKNQKLES
jgi:hypothetical protein